MLRPGGRIALAIWDALEQNPWAQFPALELSARGITQPPAAGTPGPFSISSAEQVVELLAAGRLRRAARAGDRPAVAGTRASMTSGRRRLDLSRRTHDAVLDQPEQRIAEIAAAIAERLVPYRTADGGLSIPGRALVASADA